MTPNSAAIDHFERVASGYAQATDRWPWRVVRRVEMAAVLAALGPVRDTDVLELGCGAGFYTRLLLAGGAGSVTAVDAAPSMVAALPDGVRGLVADAAEVDPGRTFPVLLSAGMLEFVPDPEAVLRHARTLADPGAHLVVLAPRWSVLGWLYRTMHRLRGVRIRLFTARDLAQLATRAGWSVHAVDVAHPYALVATLKAGRP